MIFDRRTISRITRRSVSRWRDIVSANLSIGTASAFVLAVAVLSFLADDDGAGHKKAGGDWSLRGALAPVDQPKPSLRYALHSG